MTPQRTPANRAGGARRYFVAVAGELDSARAVWPALAADAPPAT